MSFGNNHKEARSPGRKGRYVLASYNVSRETL
jgi:hypothetical protein